MHARITLKSKFSQKHIISASSTYENGNKNEIIYNFSECVLVPGFSKMSIDIPDYDFYYQADGKESSFFINQLKFYKDVKIIDFLPPPN
jgi:ABC-type uncharacterized transport system YnjBCD substrate-binding protein